MQTNIRSGTRIARIVGVALAAGLLVGLARPPSWAGSHRPGEPVPAAAVHVVAPGETLWGIAEHYAPAEDPRVYIYNLEQLNHVGDGSVRPGEKLTLP